MGGSEQPILATCLCWLLLCLAYLLSPCTSSCSCPDRGPPMCGSDDGGYTLKDYKNTCHVGCEKAVVHCEGPCPCKEEQCPIPDCVCLAVFQPVCAVPPSIGASPQTYSNTCWAECDCASIIKDEPC